MQSLRANNHSHRVRPPRPALPPPDRPTWLPAPLHGGLGPRASPLHHNLLPPSSLPAPATGSQGRGLGCVQSCLFLLKAPLGASPPSHVPACSTSLLLQGLLLGGREQGLRERRCFYEALPTHQVLAPPLPSPREAGKEQGSLEWSRVAADTIHKGTDRLRSYWGQVGVRFHLRSNSGYIPATG